MARGISSTGLKIGAAGLAAAAAMAALLPAAPLAAAQRQSAEVEASALARPMFSLDCRNALPKPGFQLISAEATGSVAAAGQEDCALRRERL